MSCKFVGLILAAGFSERFGPADKRAYRLQDGRTLLAHSVDIAAKAFAHWRVVVRPDDDLAALGLDAQTPAIRTPRAAQGQATTLADGLSALMNDCSLSDCDVVAVLLGDMPYLEHQTIEYLRQYAAPGAIVRPSCRGRPGHPVMIGRDFWQPLSKQGGDRTGSARLKSLTAHYRETPVTDEGVCRDIDVPP